MPKNRKVIKTPLGVTKLNAPRKFRIGNRKGGLSAHVMSTAKLMDVATNPDMKGDHSNAMTVLRLRGVSI